MHQETDEELRSEATQILNSGLLAILSEYGEPHIIGSYSLHLMVWRDLDIHLITENTDRKAFFELGGKIANLLTPHKMHYRDETEVATEGLPRGLYWGVYLGDERRGAWKIDIWVTDHSDFESVKAFGEILRSRLNDSNRSTILRLKSECWRHPEYRRSFTSSDIYSAVLDNSVVDIEGFWEYLESKDVLLR